jgi:hypothetical protein
VADREHVGCAWSAPEFHETMNVRIAQKISTVTMTTSIVRIVRPGRRNRLRRA